MLLLAIRITNIRNHSNLTCEGIFERLSKKYIYRKNCDVEKMSKHSHVTFAVLMKYIKMFIVYLKYYKNVMATAR